MTQRRTKRLLIVLLVVIVCLIAAAVYPLPSPDGAYYDPGIGCEGDAYWIYHSGTLRLRTPDSDDFIFKYSKGQDGWMIRDVRGDIKLTFKATLLGIEQYDTSTGQPYAFLYRRSFAWIPKTWGWVQENVL